MCMIDEILTESTWDENTMNERAVKWNRIQLNSFDQAVWACKLICGNSNKCKSFNIKRREFEAGYNCVYFESVVDNKNCKGAPPGEDPFADTTYMKYEYGMCEQRANPDTTDKCCKEKQDIKYI